LAMGKGPNPGNERLVDAVIRGSVLVLREGPSGPESSKPFLRLSPCGSLPA